jgi:hypothetical protein
MPFPFGGELAVASLAGALHFHGEGVVVIGSVEVHANEFRSRQPIFIAAEYASKHIKHLVKQVSHHKQTS